MKEIIFTLDNLIDNADKLGPWSSYGLASEALKHYFPEEYDEDAGCSTQREVELVDKLGCKYWSDVVIKYHKEVGYKKLRKGYVNMF